jgi:hypothetical protein
MLQLLTLDEFDVGGEDVGTYASNQKLSFF